MTLYTRRRAVQVHRCSFCAGFIKSGAVYLRVTFPPRENGGTSWGGAEKECGTCATRFGRAGLLEKKERA